MSQNNSTLVLQNERAIQERVQGGLERACNQAKAIDRDIARTLAAQTGFRSLPLINQLYKMFYTVRPFSELEAEIRSSSNTLVETLGNLGRQAQEEKERVAKVENVLDTARQDGWGIYEFLDYIEEETDLSFVTGSFDAKELVGVVYESLSPERQEEKRQEYFIWLEDHLQLSHEYINGLYAMAGLGSMWLQEMARSYYDIAHLRPSMERMRNSMETIKRGAVGTTQTQAALRQYGPAFVEGMNVLLDGVQDLQQLRESRTGNFGEAIDDIQRRLGTIQRPQIPESVR